MTAPYASVPEPVPAIGAGTGAKAISIRPTVAGSRIYALGQVRGENVVTNDDIAGPIDSSDEWIRQRTGIVTRHRARPEQLAVDLAEAAATDALARAGLTGADIDVVIVATYTHFVQIPSAAAILADRIGATPAGAYDVSAACAGYCYGIGQADALVRSGAARYVLVVGAEKQSDFIDPTDRSISFLLGDGAGAAIVGPADEPGIGPTIWGSDGAKSGSIYQTRTWLDLRSGGTWPTVRQEGPTVYKWASFEMGPVALRALDAAGVSADELDVFIPHQANMRIIDQLIKQLKLPESVTVARDIAEMGNTSAASIPLAARALLDSGAAQGGELALELGFGAGLVFAAQVVRLPAANPAGAEIGPDGAAVPRSAADAPTAADAATRRADATPSAPPNSPAR